ncbi:MAG: hypothetical protein OER92_09390 [Alphaproteobacteria bacterium]|nr:hypothetical protein [Alphaproteobacteria bacterium]
MEGAGGGVDSGGGATSGGSSTSGGGADSSAGASSAGGGGSESGNSDRSAGGADFGQSLSDASGSENAGNRGSNDNNDNNSASPSSANAAGDLAASSGAPSIDTGPSTTDENKDRDAAPSNGQMNEEANYSIDTSSLGRNGVTDPGLTPEQSRSLATSAAVMDGYAFAPAANDEKAGEEEVVDRALDAVVGTAELTGGIAVGAFERAGSLIAEVPGAAWEGVNMVNDAAGTVLDAAVGWTGLDVFEGHAQRHAARGQAMIDGVTSIPALIPTPWTPR